MRIGLAVCMVVTLTGNIMLVLVLPIATSDKAPLHTWRKYSSSLTFDALTLYMPAGRVKRAIPSPSVEASKVLPMLFVIFTETSATLSLSLTSML